MTVRDLLREINVQKKYLGKKFLDFDVYVEQCAESDKKYKRNKQKWDIIKDGEGWEYFKCEGYYTLFDDKKIFTINVNF